MFSGFRDGRAASWRHFMFLLLVRLELALASLKRLSVDLFSCFKNLDLFCNFTSIQVGVLTAGLSIIKVSNID